MIENDKPKSQDNYVFSFSSIFRGYFIMKMEIVKGEGGMSEILKEFKKALQCLDEKQMTAWLTHKLCVFSSCTDL